MDRYFSRMDKAFNHLTTRPAADHPAWLDDIRQQVESLRFGVVQIVVHDPRVVQIERTERVRYDEPRSNRKVAD